MAASAASTRSGVIGIAVMGVAPSGASASLTAFITQAGAPAVPASAVLRKGRGRLPAHARAFASLQSTL